MEHLSSNQSCLLLQADLKDEKFALSCPDSRFSSLQNKEVRFNQIFQSYPHPSLTIIYFFCLCLNECRANFSQGHDRAYRCWIKLVSVGTKFGQGRIQAPTLKLLCLQLQNYYKSYTIKQHMSDPADYCASCLSFYRKMGACPHPDQSIIYTYLSIIPYLIPFLLAAYFLFSRRLSILKPLTLLVSAYISGDKLLKGFFKGARPVMSCKTSYGMPSSHMIVMVSFAFYRIRMEGVSIWEKLFWVAMSVAEGFARVRLNYHTWEQVCAGAVAAVIYTWVFDFVWTRIEPTLKNILGFVLKDEAKEIKNI